MPPRALDNQQLFREYPLRARHRGLEASWKRGYVHTQYKGEPPTSSPGSATVGKSFNQLCDSVSSSAK